MDYIELIDRIKLKLRNQLSEKRYTHSLEVAFMAGRVAALFKVDTDKAYLAGLLHDVARELSYDDLNKKIGHFKNFSKEFYKLKQLYHGPVGSLLARELFNINDNDILEAIMYHSVGCSHMGKLSKIIYVSDYISLDRRHIDDSYRNMILSYDLNRMVLTVIESTKDYLVKRGEDLLPETYSLYNKMRRTICEKETGI